MDSNVEVGALLRGTFETIKSTPAGSAGYVVGLGALGSAMDLLNPESISNMPYTIASVFAGFYLLRAMLVNTGVTQAAESNRVGAYFGLSILSGLGIVLGLVVLIVPGIILIVRWLLAYAILVSEDTTVTGALSESWQRTGAHFWALLAGVLIVLLIGIAALAVYVSNDFLPGVPVEAALVAGNVLLATMTVIFTALGVEAYRMLRADEGLPEVFA
jgi:hypothetical protein